MTEPIITFDRLRADGFAINYMDVHYPSTGESLTFNCVDEIVLVFTKNGNMLTTRSKFRGMRVACLEYAEKLLDFGEWPSFARSMYLALFADESPYQDLLPGITGGTTERNTQS